MTEPVLPQHVPPGMRGQKIKADRRGEWILRGGYEDTGHKTAPDAQLSTQQGEVHSAIERRETLTHRYE